MPVIEVKFPENRVITDQTKHQLISELTEAFVHVLGESVRPYTYCLIEETKTSHFGIAGRPMPDPAWLIGEEYAGIKDKAHKEIAEQIRKYGDPQQEASAGAATGG
jgi:4-oxalocrotonate tautomerase